MKRLSVLFALGIRRPQRHVRPALQFSLSPHAIPPPLYSNISSLEFLLLTRLCQDTRQLLITSQFCRRLSSKVITSQPLSSESPQLTVFLSYAHSENAVINTDPNHSD